MALLISIFILRIRSLSYLHTFFLFTFFLFTFFLFAFFLFTFFLLVTLQNSPFLAQDRTLSSCLYNHDQKQTSVIIGQKWSARNQNHHKIIRYMLNAVACTPGLSTDLNSHFNHRKDVLSIGHSVSLTSEVSHCSTVGYGEACGREQSFPPWVAGMGGSFFDLNDR
jgi:hypothetical protein